MVREVPLSPEEVQLLRMGEEGRVQESFLCWGCKNSPQMLLSLPPLQCCLSAMAVAFTAAVSMQLTAAFATPQLVPEGGA